MSQSPPAAYPSEYPPPGHPSYGRPPATRPTNGLAIAALVLGVLTLLFSVVPFVNLVGLLTGLVAVGLGLGGLAHARRHGAGGAMAGFGIATAVVGMVVSVLVTVVVGRAFVGFWEDVSQTADVPEPSAAAGEWVRLDDEEVDVRLDDVRCDPAADADGRHTCTIEFQARNDGSTAEYLGGEEVAAVVDDDYVELRIVDAAGFPSSVEVGPGATASGSGTVTVDTVTSIDAVAFNLTALRSNDTTVISVD